MRRGFKVALAIVVGLALLAVVNAAVVNDKTAAAEIDAAGARLIDTPAGQLQVAESGSGDSTLVLLHCYTCSMHWWDAILPLLERDHRVIRIDLIGHGGSEKPDSGYEMEDQARAVASVLEQLGVERATVVGHSLGFSVGVALAEHRPRVVDGLVNIDEWSKTDQGELPLEARLGYVPILGQAISRLVPDSAIRDGLEVAFAPGYDMADGFEDPDQVVEDFRAMTYTAYTEAEKRAKEWLDESPSYDRLAKLRKPLLVIFGSEDQLYDSPKAVADSYRRVPGAEIAMIEGAGHSANVERPRQTADLILRFAAGDGGHAD